MSNKLVKAGTFIFLVTFISKILGFLRETFIAYHFGTSVESDAYFVALTPSTLAITFSISLSSVFLPMFIKYANDRHAAFIFSNRILFLFFSLSTFVYLLVIIKGDLFVSLIAPGMSSQGKTLAVEMLKILFPLVFIVIAIQLYTVMLNSFDCYFIPTASILPNNLLLILYLLFIGDSFGITSVSYVTLFSFLIQFIILYIYLRTFGYRFRTSNFFDPTTKEFMVLLFPILISTAFSQLNAVVDRFLASTLQEGSISALMYSYKLRTLILGIFVTSVISVTAPKISRLAHENSLKEVGHVTRESVLIVLLLLAPLTCIFMLFSREIIEILFERGEFGKEATLLTSRIFFYSSFAILGAGLRDIIIRTFYAFGDTKSPTKIIIAGLILNMMLSFLFVKLMGLSGLGLSLSMAMIFSSVAIGIKLNKIVPDIWNSKPFYMSVLKIAISAILSTIIFIFTKSIWAFAFDISDSFSIKSIILIICCASYCLIFILFLLLFKVEVLISFLRNTVIPKTGKG
ncbi:MAG: murein biosynthesis integral membrane protein MurJ [Anoxybacillus sp.]|nr:murein biosynthesis integral membrane protein MurJ [Anoxybacillus sp.]MCL6584922.1 murein biosynthesis integral membrane protein MurJ [Anoxybacillus sp.]